MQKVKNNKGEFTKSPLPDAFDGAIGWLDMDNFTKICEFLTEKARLYQFMTEFYERIDNLISRSQSMGNALG